MKTHTIFYTLGLATICVVTIWHSAPRQSAPSAAPANGRTGHFRTARTHQKTDPAEVLGQIRKALASTDTADQTAVFSHLLAALVRADPQAAAHFAETIEPAGTRELILHRVAQLWAARDAKAALEWAAKLPTPGERDALVTDVCLQLSESDPAEAVRTLSQHAPGENPHGGLEALVQRWAENDFLAARDWALSRPAGWRHDRFIARIAFHLAADSPLEAATLVANEIPEGGTETEAVMAVLHQWATRDPAAAAEWVELFPEGGLRTRAFSEIGGIAQYRSESNR
jgi:hypothetical protein